MDFLVAPHNQGSQTCFRRREVDHEAPLSKRVCALGVRAYGSHVNDVLKNRPTSPSMQELVDIDAFEPGTPTKNDKPVESTRKVLRGWDNLQLCLLERVTRSLSAADLCRLSQVNKYYRELCSGDTVWAWRADRNATKKTLEREQCRSNANAAMPDSLQVAPLESVPNLHFSGDVTIVDPFRIFFLGKLNHNKHSELRRIVKEFGHKDLVLSYRGFHSAILPTSCVIHDDVTAFEVFRNGQEVGANVTTSGLIAVVPNRLVLQLIEENGGVPEEVRGVSVPGVDGILRCSSDGDFIIRNSFSGKGTPVNFPLTGETDSADIVCSTGGSWTEDSDSDDEEELTDEEMAEAVAEVAKITSSYSSLQRFYCNGEGLIHKFSNFEVSMLS